MKKCLVLFRKSGEKDKKVNCELIYKYNLLKNSDTDAFVYYNGILLAGDPDPYSGNCDDNCDYRFWGHIKDSKGNSRYELTIFERMPRTNFTIQICDYMRGTRSVFVPEK